MKIQNPNYVVALLMLVCLVMKPQSLEELDDRSTRSAMAMHLELQPDELVPLIRTPGNRIIDLDEKNTRLHSEQRQSREIVRPRRLVKFVPEGPVSPANHPDGTTWRIHLLSQISSGDGSI